LASLCLREKAIRRQEGTERDSTESTTGLP
jgi:hypothetical protein